MTLTFVKPTTTLTCNFLLYGTGKSGKTLGACSAPGPILLINADLPGATRTAHKMYGDKLHEVQPDSLETLMEIALEIRKGLWPTVVLDTVGELHRRLLWDASGMAIRPSLNQYGDVSVHVERFCLAMCELPINFIATAHETAQRDETTGGFERLPFTGTNNPALGAKLMNMVDVIGYTVAAESEDGSYQYMSQLVTGKGRRGGDRFNCLPTYDLTNVTKWLELIEGAEPTQEAQAA